MEGIRRRSLTRDREHRPGDGGVAVIVPAASSRLIDQENPHWPQGSP
jgi:hypothetical protein